MDLDSDSDVVPAGSAGTVLDLDSDGKEVPTAESRDSSQPVFLVVGLGFIF